MVEIVTENLFLTEILKLFIKESWCPMFAFVSNLFGVRNSSPMAKPAPIRRRAQIGVEFLEGRTPSFGHPDS